MVLNSSGRTDLRENSAYDYNLRPVTRTATGNLPRRAEVAIRLSRSGRSLLGPPDLPACSWWTHPMYETSYTFDSDGTESISGVAYQRIASKPMRGIFHRQLSACAGKITFAFVRLAVDRSSNPGRREAGGPRWISGLSDVGLAGMHSEVYFATSSVPRSEGDGGGPGNRPHRCQDPHQHWRNLHRFTDYKKFNVNVREILVKTHSNQQQYKMLFSVRMKARKKASPAAPGLLDCPGYSSRIHRLRINYYLLNSNERPFSPKHVLLRPSAPHRANWRFGVLMFS